MASKKTSREASPDNSAEIARLRECRDEHREEARKADRMADDAKRAMDDAKATAVQAKAEAKAASTEQGKVQRRFRASKAPDGSRVRNDLRREWDKANGAKRAAEDRQRAAERTAETKRGALSDAIHFAKGSRKEADKCEAEIRKLSKGRK